MSEKDSQNLETEENISEQVVKEVTQKIVEILAPSRIILYNCKQDFSGEITSFKLCVIGGQEEKAVQLKKIFSEIDSDIPYDVLIYTDEQFDSLSQIENAFAHHVYQKGKVLYGR